MSNKLVKMLLLVIAVLYGPLQAMAWGTEGHRIIGQIAGSYLTAKTRIALESILGDESLVMAGDWADFIKSDRSYSYLSPWHYIDFEKKYTYPEMQEYLSHDKNIDAYTKLQFLINELKRKDLSKENKLFYLRMLVHLVEDVHQPMHTAHADDKGGNDFKVKWFNDPTNLHAVWDFELIEFQRKGYSQYAATINHPTVAQRAEWQKAPISKWLFESNQLAEKLYTEIKPGQQLNYKYYVSHIGIINRQLLKAGVRLAGILNQIFG